MYTKCQLANHCIEVRNNFVGWNLRKSSITQALQTVLLIQGFAPDYSLARTRESGRCLPLLPALLSVAGSGTSISQLPWRDIVEHLVARCQEVGQVDVVVDQPAGGWRHIVVREEHDDYDNGRQGRQSFTTTTVTSTTTITSTATAIPTTARSLATNMTSIIALTAASANTVVEFKGDGPLWVATNQCAAGSASCVKIVEQVNGQLRAVRRGSTR